MYNNYYRRRPIQPEIKKTRDDIHYDILEDLQNSLGWLKTMMHFSEKENDTFSPRLIVKQGKDKFTFTIEATDIKFDLTAEKTTHWRSQFKWTLNGENFIATNVYQCETFLKKYFDKITQVKYWLNFYDSTAWASDSAAVANGSDRCLIRAREVYQSMTLQEKAIVLPVFQKNGVFTL